jgi:propionate CoA-transferase
MHMTKVIKPEEIQNYMKDGDTIYANGFGLAGFPEEVAIAMENSFLETGHPRGLTIYWASGVGDFKDSGIHHFAHEGMLKRTVSGDYKCGGPRLSKLVIENKFEAYNWPQGVLVTMTRNIAARRPGVITKVGLGTFIDPRVEGGKINQKAKESEDLVKVLELDNEEWLYYKAPKIDVVIFRGSVADENGNISIYREGVILEYLSAAQAARACGGVVIAQVEHIVKAGTHRPKEVRVPGIMVDYLVVGKPEKHLQNADAFFCPTYNSGIKNSLESLESTELNERIIIGRRAAMELSPGAVVNIGIGVPESILEVVAEGKVGHGIHLTTESSGNNAVPVDGLNTGNAIIADAFMGTPCQFDFYDGGGLDVAFLGSDEIDRFGNVNVSKLASTPIGCGSFINITQNAKRLVFCGTFTVGGLVVEVADRKLNIMQEGKHKKFIAEVQQITFSGKYAARQGQHVLYVTERAVFQLTPDGLELIEIVPGVDIEKDILEQMDFKPIIRNVRLMPKEILQKNWDRLRTIIQSHKVVCNRVSPSETIELAHDPIELIFDQEIIKDY